MRTNQIYEKNTIEPEQLIGTKWTTWNKVFGDRMSVEFLDRTNCIYTSQPKKFKMTYNITGNKIFINNIEGAFELRGDVLFNNDLPVFEKAA